MGISSPGFKIIGAIFVLSAQKAHVLQIVVGIAGSLGLESITLHEYVTCSLFCWASPVGSRRDLGFESIQNITSFDPRIPVENLHFG